MKSIKNSRRINNQIRNISIFSKRYSRLIYEIPERYQNAFYLANASFFDSSNWFLHRAYEIAFPFLKKDYRIIFSDKAVSDSKIHTKLENIVAMIDQCNSIIDVRFPVRRDNGHLELIRGFRAHYGENITNTPCLGGLRINENITRDHIKALSLLSSIKNSCLGIGLCGAHGGIKINPKNYSHNELQTIIHFYITELFKKGYCGHLDVIHPDINTNESHMTLITQTLSKCSGQKMNAAAMGKSVMQGGIESFEKSAALGALNALEVFIDDVPMMDSLRLNVGLKNKTFIIQGLGKVGSRLAEMLIDSGAICVGVKEHDAYLYDSNGIDVQDMLKHIDNTGTLDGYKLSKTDNPDSIFKENCDILVLAACHKSLVCYVARDVKAKIILEAADGPTTPSAHKILTSKSKLIVPDIFACAGTNIASLLEYLKNLHEMGMSEEFVLSSCSPVYSKVFEKLSIENKMQVIGNVSTQNLQTVSVPLDHNITKSTIECIMADIGQNILKNIRCYNLGTDARIAAYVIAIKNMFGHIYNLKKLT